MIRIVLLLMSLWTSAGIAASFDCSKARSNMEKAICGDKQLSHLDEELASVYKNARQKLSPASSQILVSSQRSWLRFNSTYCFIDINAGAVSVPEATRCLIHAYKDRIKGLANTGQSLGPFKTFTAIDHHIRVTKEKDAVYIIQRTFTQVDDATPEGKSLNNYLSFKEKANLPDERGTESYDVTLKHISPDWLYKQVFSETMTGAYPTSETECGLFSIKQGRPLKVSDIFEGNAWKQVFATMTKKHFLELAKKEKDFDITMVSVSHLNATQSSSPFSFCLNQKGIELVGFLPHVVRAYDGVTIAWHSLNHALTPYAKEQVKKLLAIQ
jgi:uncharacterized protein